MVLRNDAVRVVVFFLLMSVCAAHASKYSGKDSAPESSLGTPAVTGPGGCFDITELGATGNGRTDSTKAVMEAWTSACGGTGKQTIVIPNGDFLTGALNLTGPCTGDVTIQLDGNLLGSNDLRKYKTNWIEVRHVDNLAITGKGKLDGQGPGVWSKNSCAKNYNCKILPNTLVLNKVNNGVVSGITLLNAKFFHMKIYRCNDVTIRDVTITAPEDSPNTDGIHVTDSSKISIFSTTIGTGDDCISIGPGSDGINITGVTCGPGHGISVGSLGRYKDEKDVTDITVKDCVLKNTANGVRIKSYEDSPSLITASKLTYENIKMEDVANPIIIDQKYCPNQMCPSNGNSKVIVKDVTFKNITGTSSTPEAVSFICSDKLPCRGVHMKDVNVEFSGTNNKTMAICNNAKVTATGCLKDLACV
ncbi:hypothetical protein GUJ93_ZPchr0012g19039 [Zizania palustris]|uniref:Exopolygalacturonase n=1 Tax=Zizania palustris TaxID=103762 RepID=A0A8J6BSF5_ZIZPA|nr:hypothetical protein GUJ93_ZPchr0012g19039 [Zizania palustris]